MRAAATALRRSGHGIRVRFLGGAGTVTGSRFLVEAGGSRVLVDCGLYQGLKQLRLRNWAELPFDPGSLDAVVLTHAHIDHSGMLPVLVRDGYRGPIHCSSPTADLCGILLPDSGHLQEEDAAYANRRGFSKHKPALPLYTEDDARRVLPRLVPTEFDAPMAVGGMTVRLRPAGHILGAAQVEIESEGVKVLFSGDLGQDDDPVCHAPVAPGEVDAVIMESTYGDRVHTGVDAVDVLGGLVREVVASGGTLLVPSFAVGRAQAILFWLDRVFASGAAPRVPVVVDSPMATSVTDIYRRHHAFHRLDAAACDKVFGQARFTRTVAESKALADHAGPMVLLSASGMMTGGRVLHHFRRLAPDAANLVLLPGFQAPGTRGAALVAGATSIKMFGEYVPVRARVEHLDAFSAHADRDDLLRWLGAARGKPRHVMLVHGEPVAADSLRRSIEEQLSLSCSVAEHGEAVTFGGAGPRRLRPRRPPLRRVLSGQRTE